MAQRIKDAGRMHNALISLLGQFAGGMNGLMVARQTERFQPQVSAQFKQMFPPGFLALGILRPACRIGAQCRPIGGNKDTGTVVSDSSH